MPSKLVITETVSSHYGYKLSWENDGELGSNVGEGGDLAAATALKRAALMQCNFAEFEYYCVEIAARNHAEANPRDVEYFEGGKYWTYRTLAAARSAVRVLYNARNQAKIEYETGKKLPDWAQKALAHGWTPPAKGRAS